MSNMILNLKKFAILIGDIVALYLALYLTLMARYGYPVDPDNWQRHLMPFSWIILLWLIIFFINDFYNLKFNYTVNRLLASLSKIFAANILIAIAFFYFVSPFIESITPQRVLIIFIILTYVLIFIWRRVFFSVVKSSAVLSTILIIGQSPVSNELIQEINRRPQLGYKAINLIQVPDNLKEYCREHNINILISAHDIRDNGEAAKKIFGCLELGIDVYNINTFYETITNKIPVEHIDHSWFLDNLSERSKKFYDTIKRSGDIVLAIIGLIIAIVVAPIIALMVKSSSPGPAIFKQIRIGKNGKPFTAMKFRSMYMDSEKDGPKWTSENDPRITKVGKVIRKIRLDEIPQLINILRGEMSFVGPRPEQPEFVEHLSEKIPFYRERLLVRPGIAGWAQLNAPHHSASETDTKEKIQYDLYYVKNRSLILDVSILMKTIKVALGGK